MNIKIFKKRTIFIFYLITFLQDFLKSKYIYIYIYIRMTINNI